MLFLRLDPQNGFGVAFGSIYNPRKGALRRRPNSPSLFALTLTFGEGP